MAMSACRLRPRRLLLELEDEFEKRGEVYGGLHLICWRFDIDEDLTANLSGPVSSFCS